MRKSRIPIVSILLIVMLVFLQYRLWFEPGGLLHMMRLKKQFALQKQENDTIKKQNDALLQQVQRIQKNKDGVESRARHELGMIKNGETFYQVIQSN